MELIRQVIVFDAADVDTESAFWAGIVDGRVIDDDPNFHCVVADGRWLYGVQRAPDHVPPDWPDGRPQQIHVDLHAVDVDAAHARAIELGARVLQDTDDANAPHGHRVYADPAGHPFCIGWGHPDDAALGRFLDQLP